MADREAIPQLQPAKVSKIVGVFRARTRPDRPDKSSSRVYSQAIPEPRALDLVHVERVSRWIELTLGDCARTMRASITLMRGEDE